MTTELTVSVSSSNRDEAWDEFVATAPGGDHVQSSAWGRIKATNGFQAMRVVAERGGEIVGGAQLLVKRAPLLGGFGYVPRGPVLSGQDEAAAAAIVATLRRVARDHRVRHLVVQPSRHGEWLADRLPAWGFVPSAMSVAPTATVVIDLRPGHDELFGAMSKTTRKHVRRAERLGVQVRRGSAPDLAAFHRLLVASASRHDFQIYSLAYFEEMWRAFEPDDHIALFMAEHDGALVSAHLVIPFGEVFLSKFAAWSGEHGDAYPNETLEWRMIAHAKEAGFRFYDFEGFDRDTAERMSGDGSATQPQRSADSFKLKFGGSVVLLPTAFDYFPNPVVRHTYGRAYRLLTSGGWPKAVIDRLRIRRGKEVG